MDGVSINWFAVLAAAFAGFVVGGLWYSPLLFGNLWMRVAGVSEEQVAQGNKARIFGFTLIFLLIMSVCLAMFLATPDITLQKGALYGFLTGFGWIFFAIGVVALFELRSWSYILINGGYWVVTMTLMGAILGAWK
ncbi:DUF1761 domain-containing protein [Congregibacter litoralis]|uniref:Preprotein translocase subunit Sec62 n=1 Tax=Congregibacter litoralis KT71 TaxID=314285 RepID=A4A5T0_9GAMM|nr:DUF1761 domain-containing protein [Congregibacter litoralis]EAQ98377.1 Preprotein translocase subunit Sec62 [Congregibacter litoralis KT71]